MSQRTYAGLFVAEGSSDLPLAEIIESIFFERGVAVRLSAPDFSLLPGKTKKDVRSRLVAGVELRGRQPDVIVVHRDADNVGPNSRREEIMLGAATAGINSEVVTVIPVRMTEAWLLLDEAAIRHVAGNPHGRVSLDLPKIHEVESRADPKRILRESLIRAAAATGRRRKTVEQRFDNHRRQLLERLDPLGPIVKLASWQALVADIDETVARWSSADGPVDDHAFDGRS